LVGKADPLHRCLGARLFIGQLVLLVSYEQRHSGNHREPPDPSASVLRCRLQVQRDSCQTVQLYLSAIVWFRLTNHMADAHRADHVVSKTEPFKRTWVRLGERGRRGRLGPRRGESLVSRSYRRNGVGLELDRLRAVYQDIHHFASLRGQVEGAAVNYFLKSSAVRIFGLHEYASDNYRVALPRRKWLLFRPWCERSVEYHLPSLNVCLPIRFVYKAFKMHSAFPNPADELGLRSKSKLPDLRPFRSCARAFAYPRPLAFFHGRCLPDLA
jgi:hypothetical protein